MRVVTVGANNIPGGAAYGYVLSRSVGALSDTTFTVEPNDYTIDSLTVVSAAGSFSDGALAFSLTSALTADRAKLVLHVDGGSASFAFSAATLITSVHDYQSDNSGLDWSSTSSVTVRLRDSAPLSMDATLSGLAVNDGSKNLALTPAFVSGTISYTASVGSTVAEVTVTPMTTDTTATIAYLDSSDNALTDADTSTDGQQVELAVGDNVIKVKVTAEDTAITRTYTVTVNREAPPPPPRPAR